jgi:hypothetical protein
MLRADGKTGEEEAADHADRLRGPAGWRCPSSPAALASPGGIGISIEQVPQRLRRPRISSGRRCVRAGDPLDFQQPHGSLLTRPWREVDSNYWSPGRERVIPFGDVKQGMVTYTTEGGPETVSTSSGTEGSNPAPSSGESPANLRVFAGSGARNRRRGAAETLQPFRFDVTQREHAELILQGVVTLGDWGCARCQRRRRRPSRSSLCAPFRHRLRS